MPVPKQIAEQILMNHVIKVSVAMEFQISFIMIKGRTLKVPFYVHMCQTLDAYSITKSHTTAYHFAGDGLVEHFNQLLLQVLHEYHHNWE